MRFVLLLIVVMTSSISYSQKSKGDTWTIHHNRKEVASFKLNDEDGERRLVLLNRSLDEPGFVIITYNPSSTEADWARHFVITDSTGKELKKYENASEFRVHNSEIAGLLASRPKIQIHTWATPKDPAQAAAVRVRRILLCTIYTR